MKVIEITTGKGSVHNAGALFTRKERDIIYNALKEYSEKYKRKKTAKTLYNQWYKDMPV